MLSKDMIKEIKEKCPDLNRIIKNVDDNLQQIKEHTEPVIGYILVHKGKLEDLQKMFSSPEKKVSTKDLVDLVPEWKFLAEHVNAILEKEAADSEDDNQDHNHHVK